MALGLGKFGVCVCEYVYNEPSKDPFKRRTKLTRKEPPFSGLSLAINGSGLRVQGLQD